MFWISMNQVNVPQVGEKTNAYHAAIPHNVTKGTTLLVSGTMQQKGLVLVTLFISLGKLGRVINHHPDLSSSTAIVFRICCILLTFTVFSMALWLLLWLLRNRGSFQLCQVKAHSDFCHMGYGMVFYICKCFIRKA